MWFLKGIKQLKWQGHWCWYHSTGHVLTVLCCTLYALEFRIVCYKVSSLHRDVLLYAVDGGHRAVIFDRFRGVQTVTVGEGTHFIIPWVQRPIIFDIRSQPRSVPTITGSKGLYLHNVLAAYMLKLCLFSLLFHGSDWSRFCVYHMMQSCLEGWKLFSL